MAEHRSVRLTTVLGDRLRFRRMAGEEALDSPFLLELELGSADPAIELGDLLGTGMTVEIEVLGGGRRHLHGLVSRFAFAGYAGDEARYRATLRPWLWFLCRSADCRIFQEMAVPDIVRAIFDKHAGEQVHVEDRLAAAYAPRTYCVQYRESDLAFVERLLQDEGISYFFVHAADRHTLILADAPEAYETCAAYEEVPYYPKSELARRERDHVDRWDAGAEVRSGSYAHTSFDFEKTRADLLTRRDQPLAQAAWAEGELYDYSGRYTEPDAGERAAGLRLEADQAEHRRCDGEGTAAGLAAGHRFTLTGYPRPTRTPTISSAPIQHEITDPAWRSGEAGGEAVEPYRCRFTAMPADIPYRPALTTPRPLIRGPADRHGHRPGRRGDLDRQVRPGEGAVPLGPRGQARREQLVLGARAQAWAGTGVGRDRTCPRIGQEVIVEFLEGDPDRPIITGRVYNAERDAALRPAGQCQTQSRHQEQLVEGRRRLERAALRGQEGRGAGLLHAQKNEDIVVENDKTSRSATTRRSASATTGPRQSVMTRP